MKNIGGLNQFSDVLPLKPTCVFFYNILSVVVVYNHDVIKVVVVVDVVNGYVLTKIWICYLRHFC